MRRTKMGLVAGIASLTLATLSYVPSAAAFTPATLLLLVASPLAALAWWGGSWRLAALTAYVCVATLVISPLFFDVILVSRWMLTMAVIGIVLAGLLYRNYRRSAVR